MKRIWIYQADRFLTSEEERKLNEALEQFNNNWNAHGRKLASSYEIRHSLFIILKVDQNHENASGCSIDSSVHFLQEVEKHFGIQLFNRTLVSFLNNQNEIQLVSQNKFQELINQGKVNANTLVYNNLIQNYEELESNWLIPLHKSWHARVFDNVSYTA